MNKSRLLGTVCACVLPLCIASPANAAFVLTIDDLSTGGTDVTVLDGDADGVITYSGAIGAFAVNVTTGISKPTITGPQLLDLNSINVSGGAGDGYQPDRYRLYTGSPAGLTGLFGGTTIGTVDVDFLSDDANAQFGGTSFFDPPVTSTGAFSGSGTGTPTLTGPYSLTIVAAISHSGSGVTSFDAEIQVVPVPRRRLALRHRPTGSGRYSKTQESVNSSNPTNRDGGFGRRFALC